ncbi:MAG: hypothetical protein Q8S55_08170 [Methylococcaceae bacterium]|nr:hypothetical protein [Methylococcaceae bacterium]
MSKPSSVDIAYLFEKLISANSLATLTLLFAGFVIWVVGGNILVIRHYRRTGKPWFASLNPLSFPFKNFNRAEWVAFLAIMASSLVSLAVAVIINEK